MISPQASVHPDAKIGKNVTIDPFAYVAADVEIGDNSWLAPGAVVMDGARIGKKCRIFPGAVVSAIPQDLKFDGEVTTAEIGDNVTIRECVTINRGTKDKFRTKVGNNCLLMAYVHIAHDCEVGNNCVIANSVNLAGHIIIEDWVILEGLVAIQQFVRVGQHSFIAGGSKVRKNVPPFIRAAREPLSYAGVNTVGLKRRGFNDAQVLAIEDIYREIYVHNQNISKAVKIVEQEKPKSNEKKAILDFISDSTKGIIRGVV